MDYIIVFCADKMYDKKFPEYKEGKYLGGQIRMDAAVEIWKKYKKVEFILVGGYDEDGGTDKTLDMKVYIENKIDKKYNTKIEIVNSLPCTRHNLIAILNKYDKDLENKTIGILSNFYHIPRILNLWSQLKDDNYKINFNNIKLEPLIAEKQIGVNYPIGVIEYIVRLEEEIRGLIDINTNAYKDGCFSVKDGINKFKKLTNIKKIELLSPKEINGECPCGSKNKYNDCCGK